MGLEKQGSKPTGKSGYFMGKMMNLFHTGLYKKYYSKELSKEPTTLLDLGCGGGRFINYLAKKYSEFELIGFDHSEEMVNLSIKDNLEFVKSGRVKIDKGSVSQLPYDNNSINVVTAHETVQFWPDIHVSFSEIYRVLQNNGRFYIINRYPPEGTKWWQLAKLKNESDFMSAFEKAGFKNTEVDLKTKKGWIITKTMK
jgi:ubiquinone/menaquinone biosynthesis C-methylase UbiE